MVSSRLVAKMKVVAATFLTDTCKIYKMSETLSKYGTPTGARDLVASGVACRLVSSSNILEDAMQINDREAMQDIYTLWVPVGTDIDSNYQVDFSNDTFEVTAVRDQPTDTIYIEVELTRVRIP